MASRIHVKYTFGLTRLWTKYIFKTKIHTKKNINLDFFLWYEGGWGMNVFFSRPEHYVRNENLNTEK